jgi:hypothetical protein
VIELEEEDPAVLTPTVTVSTSEGINPLMMMRRKKN